MWALAMREVRAASLGGCLRESLIPHSTATLPETSKISSGPSGGEDLYMPDWFEPTTTSIELGGRPMTIETGRLAKQAAGRPAVCERKIQIE